MAGRWGNARALLKAKANELSADGGKSDGGQAGFEGQGSGV